MIMRVEFAHVYLRLARRDVELGRGALCGLGGDVVLLLVTGQSAWVRLPLGQRIRVRLYWRWNDLPTMKLTLGNAEHIRGAVATSKSMPLRYARRDKTTI